MKRGQISIFVVVAFLIVVSIMLIFFTRGSFIAPEISPDVRPVHELIQNCIEQTSKNSLIYIGDHGGYYGVPEDSLEIEIPLYYNKGTILMPSENDVKDNLEKYMDDMLFFCTKNFVELKDFEVSQGEIKSRVEILDKSVKLNVEYPVSVKKDEKNYFFKNFEIEIPVRLKTLINVSSEIVKWQKEFPKDLCITCYEKLAYENEVFIEMTDYDKETVVFSVVDINNEINDKKYVYYFGDRLND